MKFIILAITILTSIPLYASSERNCKLDYYRGKILFYEYRTASSEGNILIGEGFLANNLAECIEKGIEYMQNDDEVFKTIFTFTKSDGTQVVGEYSLTE